MSLTLRSKAGGDFVPHPEGIFPAVCLDVIDLGLQPQEFNGEKKSVQKIKIIFETNQKGADGKEMSISKNFTASLHPKAKLNAFLSKWRGRPIAEGEDIDLTKLPGASCTLVIGKGVNTAGKEYTGIDAISKPTQKLTPSGNYDQADTRKRVLEWADKQRGGPAPATATATTSAPAFDKEAARREVAKSNAAKVAAQDQIPMGKEAPAFDPEVGF